MKNALGLGVPFKRKTDHKPKKLILLGFLSSNKKSIKLFELSNLYDESLYILYFIL